MISDVGLANWLLQHVPIVIFRQVYTDHDPLPEFRNDNDDYRLGWNWFFRPELWGPGQQCDPRVYLQIANEQNRVDDAKFYVGVMKAAESVGRRVVIFNDSVGNIEPEEWPQRREALVYAKQHGHLVGIHAYGNTKDVVLHPVSAFDDEGAWPYFGGRVFRHYQAVGGDAQPDLVITECGPGKAELQKDAGFEAMWRDVEAFAARTARYPYLKAWNWWTAGASRRDLGFPGATIDPWLQLLGKRLPAIKSLQT